MLPLLALALAGPSLAAPVTLSLDLLHEAIGAPLLDGLNVLRPPMHPGASAGVSGAWIDGRIVDVGPTARLGGWSHAEVASLVFVSAGPLVSFALPADLSVQVQPLEVGFGLSFQAGDRYEIGPTGLVQAADPPDPRLLLGAGLGLAWALPSSPLSLTLSYRAGIERPAPAALPVALLPHSTLGLGLAWTLGAAPREEEAP